MKRDMRTIKNVITLSIGILMIGTGSLCAQSSQQLSPREPIPDGVVVYSLPITSLHLSVEALRESYTPGPYAKYAKKYLGITPSPDYKDSYQLLSIRIVPYIEADQNSRYIANLSSFPGPSYPANFFKFTSQGLVVFSDDKNPGEDNWRFPALTERQQINTAAATNNITSTQTTLYKRVKNASGGYDKVAVQQSQAVEKSLEKKAQEAADMIFSLRKKRVDIVTGDTDASFSGEALKTAVDEISRLESDYLSLFIGVTESAVQKLDFDVTPQASADKQLYVAFRMSDAHGLLVPENMSGRPIVLELIPEEDTAATEQIIQDNNGKKSRAKTQAAERGSIFYRVPSICLVKILDGNDLLLQSRVPIYQLGKTLSFPIDVLVK